MKEVPGRLHSAGCGTESARGSSAEVVEKCSSIGASVRRNQAGSPPQALNPGIFLMTHTQAFIPSSHIPAWWGPTGSDHNTRFDDVKNIVIEF